MAGVGSGDVYFADECSQDVFSFWADDWCVDDPVDMRLFDGHVDCMLSEPTNHFDELLESDEWLSDTLKSACPNSVVGRDSVPADCQVTAEYDRNGEQITCIVTESKDDLSVDSGCESVISPSMAVETSAEQCVVMCDDEYPVPVSEQIVDGQLSETEIQEDMRTTRAAANDVRNISSDTESDDASKESTDVVLFGRPQRVAARRAEAAVNLNVSDGDEECDDDDYYDDVRRNVSSHHKRRLPSDVASLTGRRGAGKELNRNALNARINRIKKKEYIASLESQRSSLQVENKKMKSMLSLLMSERDNLTSEVSYLKAVLANDSVLAQLIDNINGPATAMPVMLSSSYRGRGKRRLDTDVDHDYEPCRRKVAGKSSSTGGVCLHVRQNQLSLEFCHRCADLADGGRREHE